MALTLYQESIPFTNKRIPEPTSTGGTFFNPVVMSFAFDFTVCTNVLETVIYIRNDDANDYYRNVIVTLCKDDPAVTSPVSAYGIMKRTAELGPYLEVAGRFNVPATWSVEQAPTLPDQGTYITGMYTTQSMPILDYTDINGDLQSTDENITSKIAYGYDDLSNVEWEAKRSALFIPSIGNISHPDTSYLPIRLRINWKKASSLFTIRNYYIDISYEKVENIGVAM